VPDGIRPRAAVDGNKASTYCCNPFAQPVFMCWHQDVEWAGSWALRVAELHEAINALPPAASRLVGAVLASRPGWPRYAAAGGRAGQQQQDPAAAGSQADSHAGLNGPAAAMDGLAVALAAQLGAAAVFTPGDATNR
jgi:hypothetical protein